MVVGWVKFWISRVRVSQGRKRLDISFLILASLLGISLASWFILARGKSSDLRAYVSACLVYST